MAIAAGIILAWPDTAASIPANWYRVAALNGRYLRGAAAAGATGGGASHAHDIDDHTHTQNAHTHSFQLKGLDGTCHVHRPETPGPLLPDCLPHTHDVIDVSNIAAINNDASMTLQMGSSDPEWWEVIWVQSNGQALLEQGIVGLWPESDLPSGWDWPANGRDRYLKGAGAGNGGGATGGNADHTHIADAHTHTQHQHRHTGTSQLGAPSAWNCYNPSPYMWDIPVVSHHHSTVTSPYKIGTNQDATVTVDAGSVLPSYMKLAAIQVSAAEPPGPPYGLIGAWIGPAAAIPPGWFACDGTGGTPDLTDRFVLGTDALGNVTNIGGSDSHGHTAQAHTHLQNGHHHDGAASLANAGTPRTRLAFGTSPASRLPLHGHSLDSSTTVPTNQNTVVTIQDETALPRYYSVVFVQWQGVAAVDMTRVRAADLWETVSYGSAASDQDKPLDLVDICGGYVRREHSVAVDIGAFGAARGSINQWNRGLIAAIIADAPGAVHIGLIDEERYHTKEEDILGTDYKQVCLEILPANALLVALILKDSGRWYQSCGEWDRDAEAFVFTDPPTECDTDPGGNFPDAADAAGCLRRTASGGLLFWMIDDAWTARLLRCDAVPEDASGTWLEVASIGPTYKQVSFDIAPGNAMLAAVLLKDDARWQQTCGEWNEAAGQFDLVDPPVECDTDPGGDFPDGYDVGGCLRRLPSAGLLLAAVDAFGIPRLWRCLSMPQGATGTWEEV